MFDFSNVPDRELDDNIENEFAKTLRQEQLKRIKARLKPGVRVSNFCGTPEAVCTFIDVDRFYFYPYPRVGGKINRDDSRWRNNPRGFWIFLETDLVGRIKLTNIMDQEVDV